MGRSVPALVAALLVCACQAASPTTSVTASSPHAKATTPIASGQALGAPGCDPPSPASHWQGAGGPPEVRGTVTSGELWALLDGGQLPEPKRTGLKIILRMTGEGAFTVVANGPAGQRLEATWVQVHSGSNWDRPGDEWGVGFTFPVAGCWDLHVARDNVAGDIYLLVR